MKQNKIGIFMFLLPATLLFVFIFGVSMLLLFGTSFTHWSIGVPMQFSGIDNYITLFKDRDFYRALLNTMVWILLQATFHVAVGVSVALILSRKKFYWKFTRTVFMIPNIISSAALGMMFAIMLNPQIGIVNRLVRSLGFKDFDVNWMIDKHTAFWAVTATWLFYAATITLLVMAEINAIDASIYEAAQVDGATQGQAARFITLPLLRNITGTASILAATSMLQKLDILMMTTRGGPGNRTLNLPLYIYNTALINNDFSLANTAGVVLILIGLVVVLVINKAYRIGQSDLV